MPGIDSDIAALLGGDPGNPVASLADAFRRKRALATIGLATGDPAMAAVGNQLGGEAQHGVQEAIQGKHFDLQQAQLNALMAHRGVQEEQGQQRLDQGQSRVDAMNRALALKGIRFNPNSGAFENIAPLAGGGRKTVLPGATAAAGGTTQQPPASAPAASPGLAGALPPGAPTGEAPLPPLGKWQDRALKELVNDLNASAGRAGEFGKNQARVNAAKRVLALAVDERGNPIDLTPQQMPELAQSVAGMIGGSSAAQAQIEHLLPKSYSSDAAGILQYFKNEPVGAGQQAFVKNMVDTAMRERKTAQEGVDQVRTQLGTKHQRIIEAEPVRVGKALDSFGMEIGPNGVPVLKADPAAPKTAVAGNAADLRKKYGL